VKKCAFSRHFSSFSFFSPPPFSTGRKTLQDCCVCQDLSPFVSGGSSSGKFACCGCYLFPPPSLSDSFSSFPPLPLSLLHEKIRLCHEKGPSPQPVNGSASRISPLSSVFPPPPLRVPQVSYRRSINPSQRFTYLLGKRPWTSSFPV